MELFFIVLDSLAFIWWPLVPGVCVFMFIRVDRLTNKLGVIYVKEKI